MTAQLVSTAEVEAGGRAAAPARTELRALPGGRGPGRVQTCGTPIDRVTEAEAVERIIEAAAGGERLQVCTVNLQFLVSALRDRRIRRILRGSGLNVADGAPVLWLARLCGGTLRDRVAGADLVPSLMRAAAATGQGVFLLGGQGGVAARAAATLRQRFPNLRITGVHEPPVASLEGMDNEAILEEIRLSGASIVLVAFGHPRQELWIAAHRNRLSAPVAIGVGCTFDVIAGQSRRAPAWMGRVGLEWLFRLGQEPGRLWRRYATQMLWLGTRLAPAAVAQRWAPRVGSEDGDAIPAGEVRGLAVRHGAAAASGDHHPLPDGAWGFSNAAVERAGDEVAV